MKKEDAIKMAETHLLAKNLKEEPMLIKEATIEKSYGWIFKFNSKAFLETGNVMRAFGGNAPFIIEKSTGKIHELWSTSPATEAILEFEKRMNWPSE
jgi:hypothetical protein